MSDRPTLTAVPSAPAYAAHHGHRITWEEWRRSPDITCLDGDLCPGCSTPQPPYIAWGTQHPAPGQTFPHGHARRRTASGKVRTVPTHTPAWPIRSLVAFACPRCHHTALYEVGEGTALHPLPH